MTPAPVGIRCPDHAGTTRAIRAPRIVARPAGDFMATKVLIGLNVLVYILTAAQGRAGGSLFERFVLFGPFVHQGDWWRLFTSMFLHWSIIHIGSNMLALWFIGSVVEDGPETKLATTRSSMDSVKLMRSPAMTPTTCAAACPARKMPSRFERRSTRGTYEE